MALVEDFFRELDSKWKGAERSVPLKIIGSSALMLQADYERGTKDTDILETTALAANLQQRLVGLAGKGTAIHRRRRMYIDIVGNGIPFLPREPTWHWLDVLNASLVHFDLSVLDIVDVVVSKFKRFNADDKSDIEAMIARELVDHHELVSRFRLAVDEFSCDARAEDLPRYVRNLNQVERDMLAVRESEIELPSWI